MDFPDMDSLLDSLESNNQKEDQPKSSHNTSTSKSVKAIDESAGQPRQQTILFDDQSSSMTSAKDGIAESKVQGLEDVLNELDVYNENERVVNKSGVKVDIQNGNNNMEVDDNLKARASIPTVVVDDVDSVKHFDLEDLEKEELMNKLVNNVNNGEGEIIAVEENPNFQEQSTDDSTTIYKSPECQTLPETDITAEEIVLSQPEHATEETQKIFQESPSAVESKSVIAPMIIIEEVVKEAPSDDDYMEATNEPLEAIMEKVQEVIETRDEIGEGPQEEQAVPKVSVTDIEVVLNKEETFEESNQAAIVETEESQAAVVFSVTINPAPEEETLQTESTPMPLQFDTSNDIPEELDQELLNELDQMAEDQIREGTIEAAALVAAEARESAVAVAEPQLEPARSYICDVPINYPTTVILSTHDLSIVNSNPALTESELQLGKSKPYWIPDEDCSHCMLCSSKFTMLNRRHHCRCCGRVLCSACCSMKRALPYIEDPEKKQRVCEPCSKTLDRIDEYEMARAEILRRHSQRRQQNSESATGDIAVDSDDGNTTIQRKKSVLKSKTAEKMEGDQKRSVKFLDGVRPGYEDSQPGPSGAGSPASSVGSETEESKAAKRKVPKALINRRNRERRIQEEQICLVRDCHLFVVDSDTQMTKVIIDKVLRQLIEGRKITIAVKRNFWVVTQLVNHMNTRVWFFTSQGMVTVGGDELVIAFEAEDLDFKVINEVIEHYKEERKKAKEKKESETPEDGSSATANVDLPRGTFLTSMLHLYDQLFLDALTPSDESLDEKVGIRRCGDRISTFYRVPNGQINGIEAAAIAFHRPIGQNFESLPIPQYSPFMVGTFIKKTELPWALTIPNRVLLKIGLQASHFPFPVVNPRTRESAYTGTTENTVLKVFNDFRNWSYRLPKILGASVEIENGNLINIRIPPWTKDTVKQMIESNPNMLAWSTTMTDHSDSHLVAIENPDETFRTEIFTDVNSTRGKIGCNFVVLDGSLKGSNESFVMSIVEDGVIIRFSCETMETSVVKNLLSATSFSLSSTNMDVNVTFAEPFEPKFVPGGCISPIDHTHLIGKYQYGLSLSRLFRSQIPIASAPEWAVRLSTVINMDSGKIALKLQPKYFEVCEQITALVSGTLGGFIGCLSVSEQRQICIRVRIDPDSVSFDTAPWHTLEDEHYAWLRELDNQLIPYLYQLCPFIPNLFYMELHLSLIKIRLLSNVEY